MSNIEHYTFTPKIEKSKKLVLKGINSEYSLDEIMTGLKAQTTEIINITQMKSKRTNEGRPVNVYLVKLKFTAKLSLYDTVVTKKYYLRITENRKNQGTQCHNCLRYGHIARYCGMPYRCVKCSLSHPYGECKKKSEDKPTCANCGSTEHVASYSYRGCTNAL